MQGLGTVVLLPMLSGCWDNHELEDQAFITVVGIDQGSHHSVKVTYQYLTPPAEGPKAKGGTRPLTTTFLAPSFGVAPNIAETTTDRLVNARQLKVVIFSEEMAREEPAGIYIEGMIRERDYRRDVLLVTSVDPPDELIRANRSHLGSSSLNFIENMRHQYMTTAMFPETTLNQFLIAQESGNQLSLTALVGLPKSNALSSQTQKAEGDAVAGEARKIGGDNLIQFLGAEVYRDGLAVGRITGREVRSVLLLRGKITTFLHSIHDPFKPEDHETLELYQLVAPQIRAHLDQGRLHFIMDIPLYGTLSSSTAQIDYVQNDRLRKVLARAFERDLQKMTLRFLHREQKEFKGDVCDLSRAVKMRYLTEQDWKAFDFNKHFREARFTVRYHVHLKDFGKQRYPYGT